MQCEMCKYFAVPLSEAEKKVAHCPGGNPEGDPSQKVCMLQYNPDFDKTKLVTEQCTYYFPKYMRFR